MVLGPEMWSCSHCSLLLCLSFVIGPPSQPMWGGGGEEKQLGVAALNHGSTSREKCPSRGGASGVHSCWKLCPHLFGPSCSLSMPSLVWSNEEFACCHIVGNEVERGKGKCCVSKVAQRDVYSMSTEGGSCSRFLNWGTEAGLFRITLGGFWGEEAKTRKIGSKILPRIGRLNLCESSRGHSRV